MNLVILTQQYPNEHNLYRNGFVHTRVKEYQKIDKKLNIKVFVISKSLKVQHYTYDGVDVFDGNGDVFQDFVKNNKADHIFIHFLLDSMIPYLLQGGIKEIGQTVWVHGYEALSMKRRLFNLFNRHFIFDVIANQKQLKSYKNYFLKSSKTNYVFVSNWMRNIAQRDVKVEFDNYEIIPNGIDVDFFAYHNKENLKKNILMIRPFNSRKYATDIATKAIELLSKEENFSEYKITIIGSGKYLKRDTKNISQYANVEIYDKFLNKHEIREMHEKHGIFLCPTRQDAQGVSMCEAMSSGLVPVTSLNTAIPEFVSEKEGYLCKNTEELKDAILDLQSDGQISKLSRNSRQRMERQCDLKAISKDELSLIKGEQTK